MPEMIRDLLSTLDRTCLGSHSNYQWFRTAISVCRKFMKYQAASRRLRGKRIDGAAQRGDELATRQAALCLPAKPKWPMRQPRKTYPAVITAYS